jgi:hypothetical protein
MSKDEKKGTLTVDPAAVQPPPNVIIQPKRPSPFAKDHATSAAASNPSNESDSTLEEYEASGLSGPAFQSDAAAQRHRELSAPPPDEEPKMGQVGASQSPVPRSIVVQQQEAARKMVKVKPRITISRFRVGKEWYQIQAGKSVIVPKHVAELLEQKGAL